MNIASKEYIINTVFRTNILPLNSECNTSCIFCSHKQNPGNVEVFRMPKLTAEDFEEIAGFLSPNSKIVIGESATRIMEGEPLLHPQFVEILKIIRNKYVYTPIQVTTNGILLNEKLVDKLVEIGNIELNVSINCINYLTREKILGLNADDKIKEKVKQLKGKIRYSGSCVLLPEILEWTEIEEIIGFLEENGAESVRLFLPGYTSKLRGYDDFFEMYKRASLFVDKLRNSYTIPVIVEPAQILNLDCRIEGVKKGTPASEAGLKIGDIILKVNGKDTETRVDAFNNIFRLSNPELTILRSGDVFELKLVKMKNSSPGFVVLYDIDPEVIEQVKIAVARWKAKSVLFITSQLAEAIVQTLFEKADFDFRFHISAARNKFFGGTIKCAGLLTVKDVLSTIEEHLKSGDKPDLIMLPPIMFDYRKIDLTGQLMDEIEKTVGIPVDTI